MSSNRLEQYLDTLEKPLSALSIETRREWREEARQHVLAIADAHEALGMPPEQALEAALQRFGDAAQIGRQVARYPVNEPLSGRAAVALFSIPLLAAMGLLTVLAYVYVLTDSSLALNGLQVAGTAAYLLVPLLGGWLVGRRCHRRQSVTSVLLSLALAGILFTPISGILLIPAFGSSFATAPTDLRLGLLWLPLTWLSLHMTRQRPAPAAPAS
ncbi:MAG TPA: permease prefix domain 1-containing protein [Chthonomonadaceae bacterium]|nr:permease prefix domain 1-containing protein [Chthonomonadaceae bacterium]